MFHRTLTHGARTVHPYLCRGCTKTARINFCTEKMRKVEEACTITGDLPGTIVISGPLQPPGVVRQHFKGTIWEAGA